MKKGRERIKRGLEGHPAWLEGSCFIGLACLTTRPLWLVIIEALLVLYAVTLIHSSSLQSQARWAVFIFPFVATAIGFATSLTKLTLDQMTKREWKWRSMSLAMSNSIPAQGNSGASLPYALLKRLVKDMPCGDFCATCQAERTCYVWNRITKELMSVE